MFHNSFNHNNKPINNVSRIIKHRYHFTKTKQK